jgi:biotin carboxyl carrier protein
MFLERINMGKISEIMVTKGKTVKAGDREEWLRLEYSVKALVEDNAEAQVAKATIEGLIDGWLSNVTSPKPQVQQQPQVQQAPTQPTKMIQLTIEEQLEKVKQNFGEFKDLLAFSTSNGKVVIRARQFLGSEVFGKVANIARALGGTYVSEGRNSHFELPLPSQ